MTISGFVAYVKQFWRNFPDASTPVTAERLTHMESGIKGNSDAIERLAAAVVNQIVNDPNKIAGMAALFAVNQKVDVVSSDLTNLTTEITLQILPEYSDLNNFRSTYRKAMGRGWNLKNCPYTVGVVVEYLPYSENFGIQLCYTVEKVTENYRKARRVYGNGAWSSWIFD